MSSENFIEACWKPRFKAVENFLRRIAFNLGNTPSRTEVKIISCIPIDVTDLQKKIFELQKELDEVKNRAKIECGVNNSSIHTAVISERFCNVCNSRYSNNSHEELICDDDLPHTSAVSLHCDESDCTSVECKCMIESISGCPLNTEYNKPTNTEKPCKIRNIFLMKKRKAKKRKSELIYYAKTDINSPFRNNTYNNVTTVPLRGNNLRRSYLEHNMAQKRFKPQPVINRCSNWSDFSSPICRDNVPSDIQTIPCESDLCSCYKKFQLINTNTSCDQVKNCKRNMYYDSKYYDVVPVKENIANIRNDIRIQKKRSPRKPTIKCWSDKLRPRYRVPSTVVNYCTFSTNRDQCTKRKVPFHTHAKLQNKRDKVMNKMSAKPIKLSPPGLEVFDDVDLGPVYVKQVAKQRKQKNTSSRICNFASCSPNTLTNVECLSANTNTGSLRNPHEDKTETTLKQIKDILQSVLTEVKTGSKLGVFPKKDAVVQNGPSQNNVFGGSQFLQSYTYSPFSMGPYIPSCSHQMPSSTYPEYLGLQGTHLQYPLLIQPQKQTCTNCLRTRATKSVNTKHAASTATNTEQNHKRNKETERLIKEIYKSIALNVEIPSAKESDVGEFAKTNSANMDKMKGDKPKRIPGSISEIFRNKNLQNSTTTDTATNLFSNLGSIEAKFGSNRTVKRKSVAKRTYYEDNNSTTDTMEEISEEISRDLKTEEKCTGAIYTNEDTKESRSDTDTEDVTVDVAEPVKDAKKGKSGIFKKMLKIFQPKQRKFQKEEKNESGSDSGDYQTVYSNKAIAAKSKKVTVVRSRPRSKLYIYSKQLQQMPRIKSPSINPRNSPYMEQEYRRYWDEKLMFHQNQRKRYSTDVSRETSDCYRGQNPVYYHNYEARSVLVDPICRGPPNVPGDVLQHQTTNKYSRDDICTRNTPKVSRNTRIYVESSQNHHRIKAKKGNRSNIDRNRVYVSNNVQPHFIISKGSQRRNLVTAKGIALIRKHKSHSKQRNEPISGG